MNQLYLATMAKIHLAVGAADGMNGLIRTGQGVIKWLQKGALVGAAIALCWGGYLLMLGGTNGRRSCTPIFLGAAAGLVIVMGCYQLANGVNTNVKF
ncbi:hypothetical protein CS977_15120 [Listeria monocytogenes]|nr:hypothetical protein [Listeria monocytogenes]